MREKILIKKGIFDNGFKGFDRQMLDGSRDGSEEFFLRLHSSNAVNRKF